MIKLAVAGARGLALQTEPALMKTGGQRVALCICDWLQGFSFYQTCFHQRFSCTACLDTCNPNRTEVQAGKECNEPEAYKTAEPNLHKAEQATSNLSGLCNTAVTDTAGRESK